MLDYVRVINFRNIIIIIIIHVAHALIDLYMYGKNTAITVRYDSRKNSKCAFLL